MSQFFRRIILALDQYVRQQVATNLQIIAR